MSDFDWNDVFRLPQSALAGNRRIPKTVLTRQALLAKTEQKVLDKVRTVTHVATVQKSTTRILPTVDGEHDIQSVVFLRCEMAGSAAYAEVAALIHKCFPNPTVLLLEGTDDCCISVALTRKSLAEQGTTVIDRIESTGAIDMRDRRLASFIEALAFEALPQTDLLTYLTGITTAVRLSRAVPTLGFYPSCPSSQLDRLESLIGQLDQLNTRVREIGNQRRNKDTSLNESARLRMQARQAEREIKVIENRIKEICHG